MVLKGNGRSQTLYRAASIASSFRYHPRIFIPVLREEPRIGRNYRSGGRFWERKRSYAGLSLWDPPAGLTHRRIHWPCNAMRAGHFSGAFVYGLLVARKLDPATQVEPASLPFRSGHAD